MRRYRNPYLIEEYKKRRRNGLIFLIIFTILFWGGLYLTLKIYGVL